ncbi:hypothetical protein FV139_00225 [Parahaliea maris]|uniref:Uncharacterized protein n=1 Tax=Parahaliea maris TaxID=2716870 RepID=A0A5C9A518_9GAMM|nr:hypothetical protein [Parahaliea maris]TXS95975.1 hypothetical protein FV139_00225 [Parahaliea maris]
MYKALSSLLAFTCLSWLGYVFFKKSLALTNITIFQLLGWAWGHHPSGKLLCFVFALMFLTTFTMMVSTTQKCLDTLLGTPKTFVYVGDELMNRYQRYFAVDDPEREIKSLPPADGHTLRFSYPTALDTLFTRRVFLVNGEDSRLYTAADSAGVVTGVFYSLFFYFAGAMCVVILHTVARDYMAGQERTVTPFDSFVEFIVVLAFLLVMNAVLLVTQGTAYKLKLSKPVEQSSTPELRLAYQPGDRVQVRLLEEVKQPNTGSDSGLVGNRAAYYLVQLDTPQGIPVTAAFQFGYWRKQQDAVEDFSRALALNPELECEVMDDLTLRPTRLKRGAVNWFREYGPAAGE